MISAHAPSSVWHKGRLDGPNTYVGYSKLFRSRVEALGRSQKLFSFKSGSILKSSGMVAHLTHVTLQSLDGKENIDGLQVVSFSGIFPFGKDTYGESEAGEDRTVGTTAFAFSASDATRFAEWAYTYISQQRLKGFVKTLHEAMRGSLRSLYHLRDFGFCLVKDCFKQWLSYLVLLSNCCGILEAQDMSRAQRRTTLKMLCVRYLLMSDEL